VIKSVGNSFNFKQIRRMRKPKVVCVIMGGGRGTRLYPLTKERCKPAVPLGARYRLIDIPISNCLNSGFNKIFILTQFNTASLHRHIQMAYKFDPFGGGFVDILSAEQTEGSNDWYQGTADAVRQNLHHFGSLDDDDILIILSGDQLYTMDFREMIAHHEKVSADVTIAATPVKSSEVYQFGVMRVLDDHSIAEFVEKPSDQETISGLELSDKLRKGLRNLDKNEGYCLASMGIYIFQGKAIKDALNNTTYADFGKEVIPSLLGKKVLTTFIHDDYWEDIGTVKAFFEANLMLADEQPAFDLYARKRPIYSLARYLPASKYTNCKIKNAMISDGCQLNGVEINRSVIGIRSQIRENTKLDNVYMMGADHFEVTDNMKKNGATIPFGIGRNCEIKNAIIDKNARIGDNVRLSPEGKPDKYQEGGVYIRDGVLVVMKNAIIPDNTVIWP
jgi:glucose-1-phosphate adenylyltransferase